MAVTQLEINGATQIFDGSVPTIKLAANFSLPTSMLADGNVFAKTTGFTMSGPIDMGGNPIVNSVAPTSGLSLVTRAYVDALVNGFTIHGVGAVSDANVAALSGFQTIDGVFGSTNFAVLLIAQTAPAQNGPWLMQLGAWTRPSWWSSGTVVSEGNYFLVDSEGAHYGNTKWFVTTPGAVTVDTTGLAFLQDLAGTRYVAGAGLVLNGVVFSVTAGAGISVVGNAVTAMADSAYLGRVGPNGIGVAPGPVDGAFMQTLSGRPVWSALAGDVIFRNGALAVQTIGGATIAPSATTDTTNAGNIGSGTLPAARLAGAYAGIIGLGTITVGTWQGDPIAVTKGGTGLASLSLGGVLVGTGTGAALLVGTTAQILLGTSGMPAWQSLSGDVKITSGGYATVDHTPGSGFVRYTDFIYDETPAGALNGSNVNFTLANLPQANSLQLFINGAEAEVGADYTLSGQNITMSYALKSTNKIRANYIK